MLQLFRPPVFDGPTSRGLFDPKTGAMWMVDSFPCFTPGSLDADEMPQTAGAGDAGAQQCDLALACLAGRRTYVRHVDAVEALGARTVASAHGPVLRGERLDDAFDRLRTLAGMPIIPTPGQELLDACSRRRWLTLRPERLA